MFINTASMLMVSTLVALDQLSLITGKRVITETFDHSILRLIVEKWLGVLICTLLNLKTKLIELSINNLRLFNLFEHLDLFLFFFELISMVSRNCFRQSF